MGRIRVFGRGRPKTDRHGQTMPDREQRGQDQVAEVADAVVRSAVFLDPSGRRWRRTRVVGTVLLVALLAAGVVLAPGLWHSPALAGAEPGRAVSMADTGPRTPVVGEGPLRRVLEVRSQGSARVGLDPFTEEVLTTLTPAEASAAGGSRYVIQRFGYGAGTARTISMTFDDGPDPKTTRELLDVLAANKAPATFFVVGQNVARWPDLVERMSREGHAVGVHTMTHPDIAAEPTWREHVEIVASGRILRAVTGKQESYWRMPYEGADVASEQATIDGLLRAQRLGYTFASHDFDTDDWSHDADPNGSAADIPLPDLSSGAPVTMLMHDAGGPNRERTVEYVERLIPYAKAQGYRFTTMPQAQPELSVAPAQASSADVLTLYLSQALLAWPSMLVSGLFVLAIVAVVVVGFGNAALAAVRSVRRRRLVLPGPSQIDLDVSVVLAAWNEETVIARTLRSILDSDFPVLEVVVVDDGSTDGTADAVRRVARQDPRVVLLQQANAGKAHALNNGVGRARGEIVVTLDADTVMATSTITNMVRHFAVDPDGRLGAVAGVVRVGNRETNLLTRWQALEYLTQIGVERAAQDALGAISIIPGACAAWRKAAIVSAGGYSDITLAEDCDLALTMHRLDWRVTQDDEALAFTEVPETVDDLLAQRTRWTFGTLQAIWKHRDMLFRRKYGALGWFVMPGYVVAVATPVIFLPFIVVMATLAVQAQGWGVLVRYFVIFMAAHMVIAAVGVHLMRERYHHLLLVPVYRVVYEPLRAYLLYTSVFRAVKGVRMGWKKLVRTGSMDAANLTDRTDVTATAVDVRTDALVTTGDRP